MEIKYVSAPAQAGESQQPPIRTVHQAGGLTPSAAEAKADIAEQRSMNSTTIMDADKAQKKSPDAKVDSKAEKGQKAQKGSSGHDSGETGQSAASEKDDESRLQRTNLAEKKSRETERQLRETQARLKEFEAAGGQAQELQELLADGKKAPLKAVAKLLGIPEDQVISTLADIVIAGKIPKSPEAEKLAEIEEKLQAIDAEKKANAEAAHSRATINSMHGFLTSINSVLSSAPDDYELTIMKASAPPSDSRFNNAASEDAWETAEMMFANLGRVPTTEEVAKTLEQYYEDLTFSEYESISKSKKLQNKFGLSAAEKKAEEKKTAKKPESPTLSGKKTAPVPFAERKFKNDKEKLDAIIAWGKQQLGQSSKLVVGPRKA